VLTKFFQQQYISGVVSVSKARQELKADNLTATSKPIFYKT
jgi:hypothetical protein